MKTCDRTLFLVGVYFPSSEATSREALFERIDLEDKMPALLKQSSDRGEVLLVGDTNARGGNLNDGKVIFDEDTDDEMDTTWVTQTRDSNQDTVVNSNGDEILSWTRAGSLWILNGRCLPNVRACFAKQGNSNCDTWLGTSWVLDHCLMVLLMDLFLNPTMRVLV